MGATPQPELTPFQRALAEVIIRAGAAMAADLRDMAAGNYTGRHSQAFLDGTNGRQENQ